MKRLAFLFLVLPLFLGAQDLGMLREKYPMASSDSTVAKELYTILDASGTKNAVAMAYEGATLTVLAKFTKGIRKKKELVQSGIEKIEEAVKMAPDNTEIRCLRLSVQEHLPKIVDYDQNLEEDKLFIISNYPKITSKAEKSFIKNYALEHSKIFDTADKELFR